MALQSLALLSCRFVSIVIGLMIAGLMKQKKSVPVSAGTLQTDSATFGAFLLAIIFTISELLLFVTFTAISVAEHFSLK